MSAPRFTSSAWDVRSARGLALAAGVAVVLQLGLSLVRAWDQGRTTGAALISFFGYFTVLTNLLVAVVAAGAGWGPGSRAARGWRSASVRGCATVSILLVGAGYHVLLRKVWSPQGLQWVADVLLHYVVPTAALAHWLVWPPRERLSPRAPLGWSLYPIAYFAYVMARGRWLGAYPYPFFNVDKLGYTRVLMHATGLLAVFVLAGYAVWAAGRRRLPEGEVGYPNRSDDEAEKC